MMATTHGFAGVFLAAIVATVAPEFAVPAFIGGLIGGLFPDVDIVARHRRTLHYPFYYTVIALITGAIAVWYPHPMTVTIGIGTLAAALHSVSDIFGGGASMRPWATRSRRAVYSHIHGTWLPPRGRIRYDGAPEDFILGILLAIPSFLVFDTAIARGLILTGVIVSLFYTIFRKPLGRYFSA